MVASARFEPDRRPAHQLPQQVLAHRGIDRPGRRAHRDLDLPRQSRGKFDSRRLRMSVTATA